VTVTGFAVEYSEVAGTVIPTGIAGVVGPKPVPHKMITESGLAGVVTAPATAPFFAATL
jgi:hypothetical protein